MKFLLFSSLLGLGLAQPQQASCQSVPGNGCAGALSAGGTIAPGPPQSEIVDCLESTTGGVHSYCKCKYGYTGVGSLALHGASTLGAGYAGCNGPTADEHRTQTCGDGIVQGTEHCDFGIMSDNAATAVDESNGAATFTQRHSESGNCGHTTSCKWKNCPWRIARNAPTPLVKWNAVGNNVTRDGAGGVDINFALLYPKTYHNVHDNAVPCDEMDYGTASPIKQGHEPGSPYDDHPGITTANSDTANTVWHWPHGYNIGATSIDLAKTSQQGGAGAAKCRSLNAATGNEACPVGATADNCEEGWFRDGQTLHDGVARQDACVHHIYYRMSFKTTITDVCYTLKHNGDALSYFTSYLRVHNVEVDLDVEDLRNAQYVLGNNPTNGKPGGMFSRIFTRRNVDIELPFFVTFNRTVEATAQLAVTSSLFGFSAVVDYVEYIINAFGAGGDDSTFEDGSTSTPGFGGLGSGSGSITIATSINPGYALDDASGTHGALVDTTSVKWGAASPTEVGSEAPYVETSFGCIATNDTDTVDGGTAHRCEQFWKYTVQAEACSFAGTFKTDWDVRCNKDSRDSNNANCPGASGLDQIVYERDDDGNVLATTNKVAITFTLDPGPDDCVQEFDNDVVLSADLVCDSLKSGAGTTELFHNQMLFCSLTVDAGIEITGMTLIRVENKGPTPAQNDILFPNALGISEFNWANGEGSAVNIHDFEFRVTPKMFRQDFDARNTWFIYALAKVDYAGKGSGSRRLLSLSPSLAKQRAKCLENGCADIGPIRSLLQLDEESGGEVQAASKAFISGLDYQPDVPVVADDVYLADLDMGMEDEEDAAQPIVLNTLVLAGLGFLAMH